MTRRLGFFIILGLSIGLVVALLVRRTAREEEFTSSSSLVIPPATYTSYPLASPTVTRLQSPLPVLPTTPPLVTTATLEAIRANRPTATPPSPSGSRLPYISPNTWRSWALRILAVAGLLAYIGLRLRRGQ
jgi:hypothetical protein